MNDIKITVLGTGNAQAVHCYNTCLLFEEADQLMLVDGGGGNGLLRQLEKAGIEWQNIRNIFVSHKHIDHLLGVIWILRLVIQGISRGTYSGTLTIYAHDEIISILRELSELLFVPKDSPIFDSQIRFIVVADGEKRHISDMSFSFFDLHSHKAKQYGFACQLNNGKKIVFCGDEPCPDSAYNVISGADVLFHEAFCLFRDKEIYQPYKKSHTTVKDACELAEKLNVKKLVLFHTEDDHLSERKLLYSQEGKKYFHGELWVPDDLESILV